LQLPGTVPGFSIAQLLAICIARCGDSPRVSPIFLLPNSGQKSVFLHNESLVARLNGLA
jgi:hypothetical protein